MRIVHTGTLGWERSPLHFLKAIRYLKDNNPSVFSNIEVVFVGQNSVFRDGKTIREYLVELGLNGSATLTGFVSRKESLEYMATADILLLIIGEVPEKKRPTYGISAKIYDYALMGKPVITIASDGASAEMARYLQGGIVIRPDDVPAIAECVARYYVQFRSPTGITNTIRQDRLEEFDFCNLTKKLAVCFGGIARRK
jgi:glycosyltransferase involved in cell wall biosynthesis